MKRQILLALPILAAFLPVRVAQTAAPLLDAVSNSSAGWETSEPSACTAGVRRSARTCRDIRHRTPAMIGDFFGGSVLGFQSDTTLDRLMVVADDLDAPAILPSGSSVLSISEPGPVGVFSSSVSSVQQLQSLLRAGQPIPAFTLAGGINDDATLTTVSTIAGIQSQLAGTGLGYDIILLAAPPASYDAAVNSVFQGRNAVAATTVLDSASSGALIQGGVDTLNGGEDLDAFYAYDYVIRLNTALTDASSGGVGRNKIAENGSVLPQDRVFFRYGGIFNTLYANNAPALNRFVPGFERTFLDGLMSFELRAPLATDAIGSCTLNDGAFTNGERTRFGNLTMIAKGLLADNGVVAVSGGVGVSLPTASDTVVRYQDGQELLRISSEAVHLQPFLGLLYTPSERVFAQTFLQYDVATSGNTVYANPGAGLSRAGSLTDSNFLLFDASVGYWLHRNECSRGLTGIIPTLEIHQTVATDNGDLVTAGPFQIGNFSGDSSFTSFVAGTTFEFGGNTQLTAGYATGVGSDRHFDGAVQVQFNRRLGP